MSKPPYYMSESKGKRCGTCAYAEFAGVPLLECHRHAPAGTKEYLGQPRAVWPAVEYENVCGDFKADRR